MMSLIGKQQKAICGKEKYDFIENNFFASSIYFLFQVCGVLPDTSGRIEDKTVEQYHRPFRKSSPDQTREGLYKIR